MQQSHIPSREQSDASLIRFFTTLGHRPPATLTFHASPRLSGRPVHAGLSNTVARLRAGTSEPAPKRRTPRLVAMRDAAEDRAHRIFGLAMMAVSMVIMLWIVIPSGLAMVAGAL